MKPTTMAYFISAFMTYSCFWLLANTTYNATEALAILIWNI